MLLNVTILPGDGIGPEVTEQAVLVLQSVADAFGHQTQLHRKHIGGAALAAINDPLPPDTIEACLSSSAVLLGAVGVSGDGVDEDDEVATKAVTNAGFCLAP